MKNKAYKYNLDISITRIQPVSLQEARDYPLLHIELKYQSIINTTNTRFIFKLL